MYFSFSKNQRYMYCHSFILIKSNIIVICYVVEIGIVIHFLMQKIRFVLNYKKSDIAFIKKERLISPVKNDTIY